MVIALRSTKEDIIMPIIDYGPHGRITQEELDNPNMTLQRLNTENPDLIKADLSDVSAKLLDEHSKNFAEWTSNF